MSVNLNLMRRLGSGMGLVHGLHFLNDGCQAALLLVLTFLAADIGLGSLQLGVITAAHFALGVVLAVPASVLARTWGGERLLLGAMLVYGLALSLLIVCDSFTTTLAVYLVAGLGFGVFHPVAFALVARRSTSDNASRSMGVFTAIGDVGRLALSAGTAGLLILFAWRAVAEACGLLALVLAFQLLKTLPNRGAARDAETLPARDESISPLALLLGNRAFAALCAIGFVDALANSALNVFLPLLLVAKGLPTSSVALLVSLFYAASLLGKVLVGCLADRCGRTLGLALTQAALALCLFVLCGTSHLALLIVSVALVGALSKGSLPVILGLTAQNLPRQALEVGFGTNQTFLGIATTLSPLLLGLVAQNAGAASAFLVSALLSGVLAAVIVVSLIYTASGKMAKSYAAA